MENAANDGLRWRLQKVNVVLRNEAEKITPPRTPGENKEGKMESGGRMLGGQGQFTADIFFSSLSIKCFHRRVYTSQRSLGELTESPLSLAFLGFSLFSRGGWTCASQKRTSQPGLSHGGRVEQKRGRFFKLLYRGKGTEVLKYGEEG